MIEIGGYLFGGLGNLPAGSDGGCVARVAPDGTVTVEYQLSEQGCHDMHLHNGKLYIPGTDPTDDWTLGNIYIRDAEGAWTKLRTLPLVIHTWGLCHDALGRLWAATGAHTGDNVTWAGNLYRSDDDGMTWGAPITLSNYRMFDVALLDTVLYALALTVSNVTQLWRSADDGDTWQQVVGVTPTFYQRLIEHNGKLHCLRSDGFAVLAISPDGSVETIVQPERCTDMPFSTLASSGTNLYFLDRYGAIWNALTGVQVSAVPGAISIGYWPSQACLIASTAGAQAALYKINLN